MVRLFVWMEQSEWDQDSITMNLAENQRLKLPILQWLLLVFLSAGLASSSFQYQSVRPFACIENTLYRKSPATNSATVAIYRQRFRMAFIFQNLNIQLKSLQFLSGKLQLLHELILNRNPVFLTLVLHFNFPSILPRCSTVSFGPDFIFRP